MGRQHGPYRKVFKFFQQLFQLASLLRSGFLPSVGLGFTCVGLAFVFLFLFAIIEKPARAGIQTEDDVWTEEKARASRL